jgi:hypothetical protein
MYNSKLSCSLPLAAALFFCAAVAKADVIQSYNFSGTLATAIGGNTSVTGQFTLDFTTSAISAFQFSTPAGTINATNEVAFAGNFFATSPSATFTILAFVYADSGLPALTLIFESPLAAFSGNTFYTQGIMSSTGSNEAGVSCRPDQLCSPLASTFASGSASPSPVVPEPDTAALLLFGSAAIIAPALKRKFRLTSRWYIKTA